MISANIEGDQLVVTLSGVDVVRFGHRRLSIPVARIYEAVAKPPPKKGEMTMGVYGSNAADMGGRGLTMLHRGQPYVEVVLGGWQFTFLRMTVADPEGTANKISAVAGHGSGPT